MVLQAGKKIYERRVSNMWNWIKSGFFALVAAVVAVFYSAQAWAVGDIEDIFTAAALTEVSTGIKALLISMIAITLMFVAYRLVRRGLLGR